MQICEISIDGKHNKPAHSCRIEYCTTSDVKVITGIPSAVF